MKTQKIKTTITALIIAVTAYSQCPVSAPNSNFSVVDGGSPGCDAGTYKLEGQVSSASSGACLNFTGTSCGLVWYTSTYSLDCPFCVTFNFTLSTLTSDGIAFTMADLSPRGSAFPCSTPFGCGEGGNIGYNTINNTSTGGGGSLTVEIDVFDNSGDGDDDPACDHVSIVEDGENGSSETQSCIGFNVDDGNSHTFAMCWDPATNRLTVSIDGTTIITYNNNIRNYFTQNNVHFAFSSGYNSSFVGSNTICNWTVTPGTLSLNKADFTAKLKDNYAEITWDNSEKSDVLYSIEKSIDGENFETIHEVESSSEIKNYYYKDYNLLAGNNYYRLKKKDLDGNSKTDVSKIRVVKFENINYNIFTFNKKLSVVVNSVSSEETYSIEIYDIGGRLLYENSHNNSTYINMNNYEKGTYIVKLMSDKDYIVKKIIL